MSIEQELPPTEGFFDETEQEQDSRWDGRGRRGRKVSAQVSRPTRDEELTLMPWAPASALPEPDKQPGYVYRWIRGSFLGQTDPKNVIAKMREGWELVRVEEQPMFAAFVDADSKYKDNIEVGGLILAKLPVERARARKQYYTGLTSQQMQTVDNDYMRENDPRMPLFRERKSTVSFGNGG